MKHKNEILVPMTKEQYDLFLDYKSQFEEIRQSYNNQIGLLDYQIKRSESVIEGYNEKINELKRKIERLSKSEWNKKVINMKVEVHHPFHLLNHIKVNVVSDLYNLDDLLRDEHFDSARASFIFEHNIKSMLKLVFMELENNVRSQLKSYNKIPKWIRNIFK